MLDMDVWMLRIDSAQGGGSGGAGRARQTKEEAQKQMCDTEKVDFAPLGLD